MVVLGFLPEKKPKRGKKAERNTADMVTVLPEAPLEQAGMGGVCVQPTRES